MIITLQFLIFSELKNNSNFWLWDSKTKNGIDKLDTFNKIYVLKLRKYYRSLGIKILFPKAQSSQNI